MKNLVKKKIYTPLDEICPLPNSIEKVTFNRNTYPYLGHSTNPYRDKDSKLDWVFRSEFNNVPNIDHARMKACNKKAMQFKIRNSKGFVSPVNEQILIRKRGKEYLIPKKIYDLMNTSKKPILSVYV